MGLSRLFQRRFRETTIVEEGAPETLTGAVFSFFRYFFLKESTGDVESAGAEGVVEPEGGVEPGGSYGKQALKLFIFYFPCLLAIVVPWALLDKPPAHWVIIPLIVAALLLLICVVLSFAVWIAPRMPTEYQKYILSSSVWLALIVIIELVLATVVHFGMKRYS